MNKINKISINFSNPLILYSTVWIASLFLYSLKFTVNIKDLYNETLILILGSIFNFALIYSIFIIFRTITRGKISLIFSPSVINGDSHLFSRFKLINKVLIGFWAFFTFIEIVQFGGVPLFSVLILKNYTLDYTKFGIPTLHGLLNACYYTIVVCFYLMYTGSKKIKYIFYLLALLLWPILLMSRALLLCVLIEVLCVYLLHNVIRFKKILFLVFLVLVFIITFGYIGDSRVSEESKLATSSFVSPDYENISDNIPSGFIWVYLYITTPINNINSNIQNLNPKYNFKYTLVGLIPSFIRDKIYKGDNKYSLELESEAFNVSSFFANYLNDFGIFGSLLIVAIINIVTIRSYFLARKGKYGSIISYACLFYALFTSIFFDNFFSLVTVFQFFFGFIINYFVYVKKQINV